jgi:hypothetical protein
VAPDTGTPDTYTYDENGNPSTSSGRRMTCRVEDGITYLQTYNTENRIASISKLAGGDCSTPGDTITKWDFSYVSTGGKSTEKRDLKSPLKRD